MPNIKAILKFYVRQMWQGTQQATKNHFLPTTERKKDWSKKDWLLVKRKRNFFSLLAKLLHASMHTWPGQSDPRTNCQYGNNLVKQLTRWKGLHINTHTSSRWVNIFFQSRSKLYPGKHKSVTPWKSPKCRSGIFGRKTKMQQLTNENQCIRQHFQITNPAPLPW